MLRAVRYLVWLLAKLVLGLRYRVRVEGLEHVRGLRPVLVLPNHPAYIDPPLVLTALFPALAPRPMVYANVFRNPLLFWLPKILNAVEVPDLTSHSTAAREQAQAAIAAVVAGLRSGQNHILWPSGHIESHPREDLGAARSLADILRAVPDAGIVAVRTRGLWGSRFGYAFTGRKPRLVPTLLRGLGILLSNLIFFAPRRRVTITVERFDRAQLPPLEREAVNPFFESWYNAPGPESPTFVPAHFLFGRRAFTFPPLAAAADFAAGAIKPDLRAAVLEAVAERLGRDLSPADSDPAARLDLLGLDSLDQMELALALEQRFGFTGGAVPTTMGDLYRLAQGLVQSAPPKPAPPAWFHPPTGDPALALLGPTIAQAFVRRALQNRRDVAAADDLSGALTYERLLVAALAMARRLGKLPIANCQLPTAPENPPTTNPIGNRQLAIGILLPSSVATDLVFLAAHLAGRTPVLLNWTTGPANLSHAAQLTGLTHVVTSRRFIDRTAIAVPGTQYLYLEDLRAGIGKLELLTTLLRVRFLPGSILRRLPRPAPPPDSPAVILFTSGSEKAPKAVPLTHANLLANMQSILDVVSDLSRPHDALFGFLPAFHSFGLTVTTLFPILSGLRLVHHPDPTDAAAIVRKIAAYRPTILAATPTFLSYILDRAKPEDLASLERIVVGAEKCPDALFDRAARFAPRAEVLEGYGITECSPLVAVNPPGRTRRGTIGLPMPGVTVCVVDPDSFAPRPTGELGMLLVRSPSVFPGYLGGETASPFHEMGGHRWYVTGDLAFLDADGYIHFAGRLKRFLKAGGEMISLPALEEPFAAQYPPTEDGPRVAVEGVETPTGRNIVLFTTQPLTLRDANTLLFDRGFRGVMRLDDVRRLDKIPVLGTGKTDYKVLRAMIAG